MNHGDLATCGRPLLHENDRALIDYGLDQPDLVRRRAVLKETLAAFSAATPPNRYHEQAQANLRRWRAEAPPALANAEVTVLPGDWGDVTLALTKEYGTCFAVLNMANAYVPGGGYVEGMVAQEENMFRRTDCHFSIGPHAYDADRDLYLPHMTALLSAANGRVYLDSDTPRVCLRGSEDRARDDLGYPWLPDDEIFPFYELRAAAVDLSDGTAFDPAETRSRIRAQLVTLHAHGIRYAVLGAFGCGAFRNPSTQVARLYKEEIDARRGDFSVLAFAIFNAGYGPGNFQPFSAVFDNA